ncbi:MAG: HAD-IIIA family hydrolase [Erysipelotrichaceae bacterium]|nr:HAD-IIIA family hydrolase [Erysipelotrichaceae bacterium]
MFIYEVTILSKYIPTKLAKSIYDIDYNELYANGKRIILFDLDNTLISYYENRPNDKLIEFGNWLLSIGFKVYVLSNNKGKRINLFMETFPATGSGNLMKKPFAHKVKKFLKNNNINDYNEIIMIGDQLVTDILCANNVGVESILIKSISRESEKLYTIVNRWREPYIVKRIARKNPEYAAQIYEIIKKEKNHG